MRPLAVYFNSCIWIVYNVGPLVLWPKTGWPSLWKRQVIPTGRWSGPFVSSFEVLRFSFELNPRFLVSPQPNSSFQNMTIKMHPSPSGFRLYCSFYPNVVKIYASTNRSRPPCLLWRIRRMILTYVDHEWRQGHVEFRYVSHCCSDWGRVSQNQICIRPDLKRSRAFCSSRCGKYRDLVPKIRFWPLGTVVWTLPKSKYFRTIQNKK